MNLAKSLLKNFTFLPLDLERGPYIQALPYVHLLPISSKGLEKDRDVWESHGMSHVMIKSNFCLQRFL